MKLSFKIYLFSLDHFRLFQNKYVYHNLKADVENFFVGRKLASKFGLCG